MNVRRLLALVRAPLWWTPKVLPVVAAAELAAIAAGVPGSDALPRVLAMVISAAGVAAFAHLVNDVTDREADLRAGKRNAVSGTARWVPVLLLVVTAIVSVVPWLLVPVGLPAAIVLAALVLTSIAYSVPPLRLKQRGMVGVVADAAVAHLLPTMFAFALMGSVGTRTASWWVASGGAAAWSLGFGIRSIVVHQILDVEGDRRAGVATFVARRGVHRAARTARDMVAFELVGLAVLAAVTAWVAWGAAVFFAVHFALWLHHRRWERPEIDMVPMRHGQWLPLAEFYEVWPALAFGVVLTFQDVSWAWLLAGIVVVFWPAVEKQLLDQLTLVAELVSWTVHVVSPVLERIGIRTGMTSRSAWGQIVHFGWVVRSALNRAYHGLRVAVRETWFAAVRGWWAIYRTHWRVRHWFGPLVLFVRRQRRRIRRLLGRGGRRDPSPNETP